MCLVEYKYLKGNQAEQNSKLYLDISYYEIKYFEIFYSVKTNLVILKDVNDNTCILFNNFTECFSCNTIFYLNLFYFLRISQKILSNPLYIFLDFATF